MRCPALTVTPRMGRGPTLECCSCWRPTRASAAASSGLSRWRLLVVWWLAGSVGDRGRPCPRTATGRWRALLGLTGKGPDHAGEDQRVKGQHHQPVQTAPQPAGGIEGALRERGPAVRGAGDDKLQPGGSRY